MSIELDPYTTWDDAIAAGWVSDEPDGRPDTHMVPLVEDLRAAGFVTLQSCQGHEGTDDGCLWLSSPHVSLHVEQRLMQLEDPFTRVALATRPEDRIELGWHPSDRDAALAAIRAVLLS